MICVGNRSLPFSCSPSRRAAAVRLPSRRTCWSSSASPATRSSPSRTASGARRWSMRRRRVTAFPGSRSSTCTRSPRPTRSGSRRNRRATRSRRRSASSPAPVAEDMIFVVLIGHGTLRRQGREVQPAGAGHDRGGLRAVHASGWRRAASCSSTPRARAVRSSKRCPAPAAPSSPRRGTDGSRSRRSSAAISSTR